MPKAAVSTGMELEYESFGSPSDPTILLVCGYTGQLIWWPASFCEGLVAQGFHVVRFDNRDAGLSTKLDGVEVDTMAVIGAVVAGEPIPPVPYTLSDLAADAMALLDVLGIATAHVVGVSMGGMIAQTIAIEHPTRVASMTSIMSMTGELEYGQAQPEAVAALLTPAPGDRAGYIEAGPRYLVFKSKKYGNADDERAVAAAEYDRSYYPQGGTRQLAAIYASGSRAEGLAQLDVPTLVVHGRDDTLIGASGGARTAELVPGSVYALVSDMGHDLPTPLIPFFVDLIAGHCRRAASAN